MHILVLGVRRFKYIKSVCEFFYCYFGLLFSICCCCRWWCCCWDTIHSNVVERRLSDRGDLGSSLVPDVWIFAKVFYKINDNLCLLALLIINGSESITQPLAYHVIEFSIFHIHLFCKKIFVVVCFVFWYCYYRYKILLQ